MRIGIIALNWQPQKIGGTETYFRTLVEQLQVIDERNEYIVVLPEGKHNDIQISNSRFSILELEVKNNLASKILQKGTFLANIGLRSKLAKVIDDLKCNVLHFPLQTMLPYDVRTPSIVSCMDIQHEYLPQNFSIRHLVARRIIFKPSLVRAKHIIAISDFVQNSLLAKYSINKSKITTVYLGVNKELFESKNCNKISAKKLPAKYLYYPAAAWPHKNHIRLLQAFSLVLKAIPDLSLVLSGSLPNEEARIRKLINEFNLNDKVMVMGYVKYNELPLLYQNAMALIFPSLYEGFGLPVIEAMYAGCPVICSKGTSLPEIAGDAAKYFNPLDIDDIASSVIKLLSDESMRRELIRRGKVKASEFSASKMARETINIYENNK